MSEVGFAVVGVFFVLMLLRVPLYVSLLLPAIVYMVMFGVSPVLAAQRMVRVLDSFTLLAVPLFIYVGSLMNHSGTSEKIFDFSSALVGHVTGGTAQVNVIASLIFSGISGSALADVGGIGRILIGAMNDEGYDRGYSAAVTSASATIGPIFPPSIPLIIFAVLAETSAVDLLLAGIAPALVATGLLMVATYLIARHNDFPSSDRLTLLDVGRSLTDALPAILAPVVLIGGMMLGYFGPTEAAAVTVLYVVSINVFVYHQGTDLGNNIWKASVEATRTTAVVLVIVAGAALFSWVLAIERTPASVATVLFSISEDPIVLLLLVNVFLLVVGMFLEPLSALLITIPLVVPPLVTAGVDPVHVGVIMTFNLMIGLITPPLGLSLYLTSDISGAPVERVVKSILPYYVVLIVTLLIITYVPELVLWIPRMT